MRVVKLSRRHNRKPKRERPPVTIDVVSEIEIRRPRAAVAAFVLDQDNAPTWHEEIDSVELESRRSLEVGARFTLVRGLLGKRLDYEYEVLELVDGELLVVSTADGPFELRTAYTWADAVDGATTMTLRNHGNPGSFSRMSAPIIGRAMQRTDRKDLQRLKRLLEDG